MKPNSPTPERDTEEIEPYLLRSATEIASVLRDLQARRLTFTLYFLDDRYHVIGRVLGVNLDTRAVLVEHAAEGDLLHLLRNAPDITAVAFTDKVKLQFAIEGASAVMAGGVPALRANLPGTMMRLQRRNDFRVPTPARDAIRCTIVLDEKTDTRIDGKVVEMSCGGFGVEVDPGQLPAADTGTVFDSVELRLSRTDILSTRIELRHVEPPREGAKPVERLGFAFKDLDGSSSKTIQKYVMSLDQRKRRGE